MTIAALRKRGRTVLWLSVGEVVMAAGLVFAFLLLIGVRLEVALLLAGIAPASAPAATVDVVHELEAKGEFTDTLLGIVAIDDAWGLLIFSILMACAQAFTGEGGGPWDALLYGSWEVGGAFLIGIGLGIPMAFLTGRIQPGEPSLAEALGLVFICGAFAVWLDVSYILAAMVLGATVANLAFHHERPFNAIEGIEWPFMIIFFVLAGASLHVDSLLKAGVLGGAYMSMRVIGLVMGARVAGRLADTDIRIRKWMGVTLMPQAGVALGLALIASHHFPAIKETIIPVVIGSTVIFEILGPIAIRRVLVLVGDAKGRGSLQKSQRER
jgi:Kef-type K+ transport system membrane component KefB